MILSLVSLLASPSRCSLRINLQYPWRYPPPLRMRPSRKIAPIPISPGFSIRNLMKVLAFSYGWNDTVAYHNVCSGVIHGYPYFIRFPPAILRTHLPVSVILLHSPAFCVISSSQYSIPCRLSIYGKRIKAEN